MIHDPTKHHHMLNLQQHELLKEITPSPYRVLPFLANQCDEKAKYYHFRSLGWKGRKSRNDKCAFINVWSFRVDAKITLETKDNNRSTRAAFIWKLRIC